MSTAFKPLFEGTLHTEALGGEINRLLELLAQKLSTLPDSDYQGTTSSVRPKSAIILESTLMLPGCTESVFVQFEKKNILFPEWMMQLYTEVGAAHISWRLSPTGYDKIEPNRMDNLYRYDISGNFDLLSLDEVIYGFTGSGWQEEYRNYSQDYYPVDFSSYFLNLGYRRSCQPNHNSLLINILYEERLVELDISLADYLFAAKDRLFIVDWQLSLLNDEKYADADRYIKQLADFLHDLI